MTRSVQSAQVTPLSVLFLYATMAYGVATHRIMDVPDLLHMFEKTRGEQLDDDKLLLAA